MDFFFFCLRSWFQNFSGEACSLYIAHSAFIQLQSCQSVSQLPGQPYPTWCRVINVLHSKHWKQKWNQPWFFSPLPQYSVQPGINKLSHIYAKWIIQLSIWQQSVFTFLLVNRKCCKQNFLVTFQTYFGIKLLWQSIYDVDLIRLIKTFIFFFQESFFVCFRNHFLQTKIFENKANIKIHNFLLFILFCLIFKSRHFLVFYI